MAPTEAHIVHECGADGSSPIANGAPDGGRSIAVSKKGLGICRRIVLKGACEAARKLILVGNSVVNLNITLVGVVGRSDILDGVISQVIIDSLWIKGRCKQRLRDWADHGDWNLVVHERRPSSCRYTGRAILPSVSLTRIIELN